MNSERDDEHKDDHNDEHDKWHVPHIERPTHHHAPDEHKADESSEPPIDTRPDPEQDAIAAKAAELEAEQESKPVPEPEKEKPAVRPEPTVSPAISKFANFDINSEPPAARPTMFPQALGVTSVVKAESVAKQPATQSIENTPDLLVLQWLAYGFWGWALAAFAWLASSAIAHFFPTDSSNDFLATYAFDFSVLYPLAATITLLIVALATDFFYSRREQLVKEGAAKLLLVVHGVIYSLLLIAAVVGAVYAIVRMLVDSDSTFASESPLAALLTSLLVIVVYGALLVRVFKGAFKPQLTKITWGVIGLLSIGVIILAITGPIGAVSQTKNDRLIEDQLPEVSLAISDYAGKNSRLPDVLADVKDLTLQDDTKKLIDKNLVTYKKETADPKVSRSSTSGSTGLNKSLFDIYSDDYDSLGNTDLNYTLCVTYAKKKSSSGFGSDVGETADIRVTSPSTYTHDAGEVCYKLRAN